MSLPRQVLPETTYFITRRVIGRRFLLRPDPQTLRLFLYCLGLSATKYRLEVHSLCVMSNHYHLIATDTAGVLPLFLQHFHRLLAIGLQRQRRWDEVVWEPNRQTSVIELLTDEATVAKTVYLLTNPVAAGLVMAPADWPGAMRARHFDIERPSCFAAGRLPERATLAFVRTRQKDPSMDIEAWVASALPGAVASARRKGCLGAGRALRVSPLTAPQTRKTKWGLSPRLAAMTRAALAHGIAALRAFRAAYRAALEELRRGASMVFPRGTWQVARLYGVPTAT